jgi:methyltransferase
MSAAQIAVVILILVAVQRISELVIAKRNTARLLAAGAVETGAAHYPLFVILHSSWLFALSVWVIVQPVTLSWPLIALFVLLQLGRLWVLVTLGPYWTTRIITPPNAPLITSGPYRFVKHPNYWIVIGEIAALPLALGAWPLAVIFSIANAVLLRHRIRLENAALADRS